MAGNPCKAACVWTSAGWNREGWGHQDRADCPPCVASSKKFAWHVPDHGEPGVWGFSSQGSLAGAEGGAHGESWTPTRGHRVHRIHEVPTNPHDLGPAADVGVLLGKACRLSDISSESLGQPCPVDVPQEDRGQAHGWGLVCNEV